MDKILTVLDVAEVLQVKPVTVREMFREKRLRAFKVGKSWRTTEAMLQEDVEALSRGESPAELPAPKAPASPSPKRQRRKKALPAAEDVGGPGPSDTQAPEAPPKDETPGEEEAPEAPPKDETPCEEEAPEGSGDDVQQLLF